MLYCRREVRDLWAFVEEQVIMKDGIGFIVGPPGTGKSLSTLCYLTQLDPSEWNVVWIHLGKYINSCLSMGSREYWNHIDLETFVAPRVAGKRLFVCLDGFKKTDGHQKFLSRILIALTTGDRHLVCASVATLGKVNQEDAEVERHRTFFMPSWTRDDYEAAVADATFYEQVASALDATSANEVNVDGAEEDWSEAEKKKHALDLKFHYAGGSCRFMFQRTTDQVKQRLEKAVKNARSKANLVTYCSGDFHDDTINTLYGMADDEGERFPVSSYAASLFAKETGVDSIAQLASRLNTSKNPAVDGHLMEWLFLASVPKRVVKLFRDDDVTYELPRAPVLAFDPKKAFSVSGGRIKGNKSWLQPLAWNQGGYDAVYFDQDKGDVMFIQVTRSKRHSFKMRFFYEVLLKLEEAKMAIKTVDVYFVVKSTQCLQFKISPIEDRDHLVMFDEKWTRPEEKKVKVGAFETVGLQ
jgi:hypothetical protein